MSNGPPPSIAERFAAIIAGMCRAVVECGSGRGQYASPSGPLPGRLILLITVWLRRMSARVTSRAARLRDGGAAARRPSRPVPAGPEPSAARPRQPDPKLETWMPTGPDGRLPRLPRGFAWLLRLAREAVCYSDQLRMLLDDPEMAALVAASPGIACRLRGLCVALGFAALPACLATPPPKRVMARAAGRHPVSAVAASACEAALPAWGWEGPVAGLASRG